MLDRSDTPFGKWCIPEYGGTLLKLKYQRSEKVLSKPQEDRPTFHLRLGVLQVPGIEI